MMSRRWTDEEDALLRRHYPDTSKTIEEVAALIGRTRPATVARSNKLRIERSGRGRPAKSASGVLVVPDKPEPPKMPPSMPAHPYWTPELDARVFRTHGRWEDIHALAQELGKPSEYVQQRFHRLSAE